MSRTHYRNGDDISLPGGCDGCSPSMINGHMCHESGCPDAWRDRRVECFECGCEFMPESNRQRTCNDCLNPEPFEEDDDEPTDPPYGSAAWMARKGIEFYETEDDDTQEETDQCS